MYDSAGNESFSNEITQTHIFIIHSMLNLISNYTVSFKNHISISKWRTEVTILYDAI